MTTAPDETEPYPPRRHVLRDLGFELEAVDEVRSRAHLPLVDECCPDGVVATGVLTTVVDVLAGSLCGRVIAPDWMATAELSLHLGDPPGPATGEDGVVADAAVVRNGRTTVVVRADLVARRGEQGPGREFGEAVLTFVRLPRRDTNLDMAAFEIRYGERSGFALEDSGFSAPWETALGLTVTNPAAGATSTPVEPYVRNSFGAVNGGVVASLAVAAARIRGEAELGGVVHATDVVVHYLTQGRVGPVETSTRVIRATEDASTVAVEVRDAGDPDADGVGRLMTIAHVGLGRT